jgi:hypothetical protein
MLKAPHTLVLCQNQSGKEYATSIRKPSWKFTKPEQKEFSLRVVGNKNEGEKYVMHMLWVIKDTSDAKSYSHIFTAKTWCMTVTEQLSTQHTYVSEPNFTNLKNTSQLIEYCIFSRQLIYGKDTNLFNVKLIFVAT